MLIQVLFTMCIMLTTIQTVIDLRDKDSRAQRDSMIRFRVNSEDLGSSECQNFPVGEQAHHFLHQTCPTSFNPLCDDPLYDANNEFQFKCRFPMTAKSVLSVNSTSFLEMMKMRDPYGRDWCMLVMFYSESCPFSARLAPHFNELAGKFPNILPVSVDASDFTKSYRLNFRYGISGTPTVLLWVNGMGVARMANKGLDLQSLKTVITSNTDLVERNTEEEPENVPQEFFDVGADHKNVPVVAREQYLLNAFYTLCCFLVCLATCVYHVRERILLSAPVLQWFQSKCGGPLSDDIYFLFYVAPPRNRRPPPPPPAAAPEVVPDDGQNDDNDVELPLPPLVIED